VNRIVRRLKSEHRRLAAMMELLAGQAIALRDGEPVDVQLLREVVDYCLEYAGVFHHPAEDRALAQLLAKRPDMLGSTRTLRLQHGELTQRAQGLMAHVSALAVDAPVARDELERELTEFVDLNTTHRRYEEEIVFPALLAALDARDWRRLEVREAADRRDAARARERRHLRRVYRWLTLAGTP
jgi:hemerythrin-like domain-containing protein